MTKIMHNYGLWSIPMFSHILDPAEISLVSRINRGFLEEQMNLYKKCKANSIGTIHNPQIIV
jgi:hypothetical protein